MYFKRALLNSHGITLLEIILITVVIGIISELIAHNFVVNAPKYRLNGAARRVAMSLLEARNRALQRSANAEIQFLNGGKQYSIWHDYDYNNSVDPGEQIVEDLDDDYPGVYVDYSQVIAFDARGFSTKKLSINVESFGADVNGKVIEVSLAGSVKIQ